MPDLSDLSECKITLGWLVRNARKSQDLSQVELCFLMAKRFDILLNWKELSKIENERVNVNTVEFDSFVDCICEIFELDRTWVQQIREQTDVKSLDLSRAVFPIYFEQNYDY